MATLAVAPAHTRRTHAWLAKLLLSALSALWFAVIPALLTGCWLHFLLPQPVVGDARFEVALRKLATAYPFYLPLALFLVFASLLRYWRAWLPGGRWLCGLPPELSLKAERSSLVELGAAHALEARVARLLRRPEAARKLSAENQASIAQQLEALRAALARLDALDATRQARALSASLRAELRHESWKQSASFALLLFAVGLAAITLRGCAFQVYRVSSGSMLPSLLPGEYVLATRSSYASGALPRRAELLVFQREGQEADGDLVKRVIGLPGDRIEMVRGGHPVINGWTVPSCDAGQYVQFSGDEVVEGRLVVEFLGSASYLTVHTPWGQPMTPYVVKPGEVFVIGDDRNQSRDSRSWADGNPRGLKLGEARGRVLSSLAMAAPGRAPRYRLLDSSRRTSLDLPTLDTRELQAGIQRCLATRPLQTEPPPPGGSP
ncbi:MAG: signal peptidase I [Polyangiaceae bacterium]